MLQEEEIAQVARVWEEVGWSGHHEMGVAVLRWDRQERAESEVGEVGKGSSKENLGPLRTCSLYPKYSRKPLVDLFL